MPDEARCYALTCNMQHCGGIGGGGGEELKQRMRLYSRLKVVITQVFF
jgi:hypothetical protein